MIRVALAFLAIAIGVSSAVAQDAMLKIGEPAPSLVPVKWAKGEPIHAFQPDRVYVVEFWATWCPRSKQAIPHLSELQKKYPDVVFIGQSVWEQDQHQIEPFLKELGEKINYRIAVDDGEQGRMAVTWLQAAGQDGIPTAFIIDRQSRITWIGHPLEMDDALDQVVKGTLDGQIAAEKMAKLEALQDKLSNAMQNNDFDAALAALDDLERLDPTRAPDIDTVRFQVLLLKHDLEEAFRIAHRLADSQKNPMILNEVAWRLVDPANPVENPDLPVAEKCALRAVELDGARQGEILDTLARVYFLQGKLDKAIEFQAKAVEQADRVELKRELQKTLEEYKLRK